MRKLLMLAAVLVYGASWFESQTGLPITKYTIHVLTSMRSVKDWGTYDWTGAGGIFLISLLTLRRIFFWRPWWKKIKKLETVASSQPETSEKAVIEKNPVEKTVRELFIDGVQNDFEKIIEDVREAFSYGYNGQDLSSQAFSEHAMEMAIRHLSIAIPELLFEWDAEGDLTWSLRKKETLKEKTETAEVPFAEIKELGHLMGDGGDQTEKANRKLVNEYLISINKPYTEASLAFTESLSDPLKI